MKPQAQPYARGARQPGAALTAMTRGRAFNGSNPADAMRRVHLLTKTAKTPVRGPRPARPARPSR